MTEVDEDTPIPAEPAEKPRKRRRRWYRRPAPWIAIGVIVVLVAGAGVFVALRRNAAAVTSETYQVTSGTVEQTVSSSGTIEPATESDLSFSSAGTVTSVDVQVGQKVTAGQSLAAIDPTTLQSDVDLAQAQVTQAQAGVTAAAGGTATATTSAAAQLASAQAKLQSAQAALAAATLTSPIAGVVAAVNVTVGDQVGGSSSTAATASTASTGSRSAGSGGLASSDTTGSSGGSSAAVSVISENSWIVDATVGSSDLPNIKPGLQAQITTSGQTQPIFGTVQSVGIVASSSSSGAAQFPVVIAVTGTPSDLYAGTSATVSIIVKQLADALTVPTLAVHTANGQTEVTVVKGGKHIQTPVTVGGIYGARTQITKGLSSGDEVLVPVYIPSGTTGSTGFGGLTGRTGLGGGSGRFGGTGGGLRVRTGGNP